MPAPRKPGAATRSARSTGGSPSAAVGVPHRIKGESIWSFVVTKPDADPTDALAAELKAVVAEHLGKAFKPDRIEFVDELPRIRLASEVISIAEEFPR